MSDEIGLVLVGSAYPTGTIVDISNGKQNSAEHPSFKGDSRIHGLFETPYHRPAARKM